jgi:rubredoxin
LVFHGKREEKLMQRWVCTICQYIYDPAEGDPENGIAPGTPFEEIPETWVCPICGAGKEVFEPAD